MHKWAATFRFSLNSEYWESIHNSPLISLCFCAPYMAPGFQPHDDCIRTESSCNKSKAGNHPLEQERFSSSLVVTEDPRFLCSINQSILYCFYNLQRTRRTRRNASEQFHRRPCWLGGFTKWARYHRHSLGVYPYHIPLRLDRLDSQRPR